VNLTLEVVAPRLDRDKGSARAGVYEFKGASPLRSSNREEIVTIAGPCGHTERVDLRDLVG
jgi:hypothetical protein